MKLNVKKCYAGIIQPTICEERSRSRSEDPAQTGDVAGTLRVIPKTSHIFGMITLLACLFVYSFSCDGSKTTRSNTSSIKAGNDSLKIEVFAENMYVPWSIVFTASDRCLVTERNGKVRAIENGKLIGKPLKEFSEVSTESEEGLMGLTLDPDYKNNKLIYLSYAYQLQGMQAFQKEGDLLVKVVRFKDNGNSLSDEKVVFDNIPGTHLHAGCRIRFGPDNKLYITTGDATERKLAQDLKSLLGKILRVNSDGTIPDDNPFEATDDLRGAERRGNPMKSPIWSYGHRNPQGIDWYPGTDVLWETEHGPSGFDGPGGGDEVNIIYKGKNYGWPVVHHRDHKDGMEDPVLEFTPAEAPASGMFYRVVEDDLRGAERRSNLINFKNNFFFGCLRGEGIMRVVIDDKDPAKVISFEKICRDYGRIREVTEGPDGAIYFSTSNRDGRGNVRGGDDKIYRISK
jgi:aldose sugar dehydrogenase